MHTSLVACHTRLKASIRSLTVACTGMQNQSQLEHHKSTGLRCVGENGMLTRHGGKADALQEFVT